MEGIYNDDETKFIYKIIMVGDSGVGKTNILTRFTSNKFNIQSKPTIGVELGIKSIKIQNNVVKAKIWDTAGQERYRAIAESYYKGSRGAMIVFDITKINSFKNVEKWLAEINQKCEDHIFDLLVGNKTDLKDMLAVKKDEACDFAEKNKIGYIETSALEFNNINEAFKMILSNIYDKQALSQLSRNSISIQDLKKGTNIEEKETETKKNLVAAINFDILY